MPLWKEHSNGERMKAFPLRSRRRQGHTLCTAVQQNTETLRAIRWEKEIKGSQIEKEVNLSSFPHDKVSYVKVIKITKETCYIKKDSLITEQRINQPINSLSKLPWQSL